MSKSQINKLGKEIRHKLRSKEDLSEEDYLKLQEYRTSFKDDLASVFNEISTLSRNERRDSIVSFRIKRIESILSKIKREPTMALGNMGDIAGCRVILYSDHALHKLAEIIDQKYKVKNYNDYTKKPKDDGYRGYHIYIESPKNSDKLLEIQLRTITTHKWASLVEIIDVILDLKLKEGEKNEALRKFLFLLSLDKNDLTTEQKKEIIDIDSQHNIYKLLNEVFLKNNILFRKKWIPLSNNPGNFYFIIEVDSSKKSNIISITEYKEAEAKYFEMFLTNKESNFVLTYIENPNYKKICIAYSSYTLIKHDYLEDWSSLAKDIIKDSKSDKSKNPAIYSDLIKRNLKDQLELIDSEIKEINNHLANSDTDASNGIDEWIEELRERSVTVNRFYNEVSKMKIPRKKNLLEKIFST